MSGSGKENKMKVAISSVGKEGKDLLDKKFGRCEFFQIYDTELKVTTAIENEGKAAGGGAGIASAQQLLDQQVDAVVTGNLGPNAFLVLKKAGIKGYQCMSGTVNSALEKLENNELEEITQAGPSHQGV